MTRKKDAGQTPDEDEDRRAFEQAVEGARPLAADRRRTRAELVPAKAPPTARPPRIRPAAAVEPLRAIEPLGEGERYAYLASGESTERLRELRSGRARPEAVLDLHGQTAAASAGALVRFVASARQRGRRLLLVIHGRGLGSGPTGPVLRQLVVEQLAQGALAADVLALASAPPALGGGGAALVLVRKR
jgi:DNA-nicking Smr family endonuclease